MSKKHPFFLIGLTGLAVTFALHATFLLTGIADAANHPALWLTCYMTWVGFVVIGKVAGRNRR